MMKHHHQVRWICHVDTAFEVTFDGFQSESDDQDDDEIVLDDETQATGMLNIPCGYCTCTVSIEQ